MRHRTKPTASEFPAIAGRANTISSSIGRGLAAVSAFVAFALPGGCQQSGDHAVVVAPERTCAGALAIGSMDLNGVSLPAKTLALSFDDGPGARTAELSTYLHAQGIPAAFFVNGKMLTAGTAVLAQLVADGHIVSNHTQTHTSLTGRATGGNPLPASAVVAEVAQTDALIAPFTAGRLMFRAPYGDFDAQTAADLNASAMSKYVGPINWDIGDHMGPDQAADWDCWTLSTDGVVLTPRECGDRYVSEIDRVGHGIVLMHDPYFIDDDPAKGGTVDMIQYIVPILKAKGYAFVRVDQVPEIAALLPAIVTAPDAGADAATPEASAPTDPNAPDASRNKGLGESAHATDPCAR